MPPGPPPPENFRLRRLRCPSPRKILLFHKISLEALMKDFLWIKCTMFTYVPCKYLFLHYNLFSLSLHPSSLLFCLQSDHAECCVSYLIWLHPKILQALFHEMFFVWWILFIFVKTRFFLNFVRCMRAQQDFSGLRWDFFAKESLAVKWDIFYSFNIVEHNSWYLSSISWSF